MCAGGLPLVFELLEVSESSAPAHTLRALGTSAFAASTIAFVDLGSSITLMALSIVRLPSATPFSSLTLTVALASLSMPFPSTAQAGGLGGCARDGAANVVTATAE